MERWSESLSEETTRSDCEAGFVRVYKVEVQVPRNSVTDFSEVTSVGTAGDTSEVTSQTTSALTSEIRDTSSIQTLKPKRKEKVDDEGISMSTLQFEENKLKKEIEEVCQKF